MRRGRHWQCPRCGANHWGFREQVCRNENCKTENCIQNAEAGTMKTITVYCVTNECGGVETYLPLQNNALQLARKLSNQDPDDQVSVEKMEVVFQGREAACKLLNRESFCVKREVIWEHERSQ